MCTNEFSLFKLHRFQLTQRVFSRRAPCYTQVIAHAFEQSFVRHFSRNADPAVVQFAYFPVRHNESERSRIISREELT